MSKSNYRISFTADIHIGQFKAFAGPLEAGLSRRCKLVLKALHDASKKAIDLGCNEMVVLGDLFESARPSPQMLAATQVVIGDEVPWTILKGNHDAVSDAVGDHALGPLQPLATIIDKPRVIDWADSDVSMITIPFLPGNGADWFPKAVIKAAKKATREHKILCFHLGVTDSTTAPFLRDAHDSIKVETVFGLMDELDIEAAFAGNFHSHQVWREEGRVICQVGTLAPAGFDESGADGWGKLVTWSPSAPAAITIDEIPGPRFIDVSGPGAKSMLASIKEDGNTVFVRWKAPRDRVAQAKATIDTWIQEGIITDGRAEPEDDGEAVAEARTAAVTARSVETFAEALAAVVNALQLPEGVTHGEILEMCRKYVG